MRFSFGLCNAMGDAHRPAVVPFGLTPTDGEFVGMMNYASQSFHDLLAGESEAISDTGSGGGSHAPIAGVFHGGSP
jgi:hypothetical protein